MKWGESAGAMQGEGHASGVWAGRMAERNKLLSETEVKSALPDRSSVRCAVGVPGQ